MRTLPQSIAPNDTEVFWNTWNMALQGKLTRLSKRECLAAYGATRDVESDKGNLLVVAAQINDSMVGAELRTNAAVTVLSTVLSTFVHEGGVPFNDLAWRCGSYNSRLNRTADCGEHDLAPAYEGDAGAWSIDTFRYQCDPVTQLDRTCSTPPPVLTPTVYALDLADSSESLDCPLVFSSNPRCYVKAITVEVDFCLAEEYQGRCTAKASLSLLGVVIACNVLKVLILCIMAWTDFKFFRPLVTVGDAVKSFLQEPESEAKGQGPLSMMDVVVAARKRKGSRLHRGGAEQKYETISDMHSQQRDEHGRVVLTLRTSETGVSEQKSTELDNKRTYWYQAANTGRCSRWRVCIIL